MFVQNKLKKLLRTNFMILKFPISHFFIGIIVIGNILFPFLAISFETLCKKFRSGQYMLIKTK